MSVRSSGERNAMCVRVPIICFLALGAAFSLLGCGDSKRTTELQAQLAASIEENKKLHQELDAMQKRLEQLMATNAALAPKVAQLEQQIDEAKRTLSRITALTPDGMSERLRAEVKRIIQESLDADREERIAEQRAWFEDLRSRHFDELVAAAHLSPEQKEKLKAYEEEEQRALRAAYMSARADSVRAEPIEKVRERLRMEKEQKIRAILTPEQFAQYQEWKRQGADIYRSGLNRRQQAPEANQKDM